MPDVAAHPKPPEHLRRRVNNPPHSRLGRQLGIFLRLSVGLTCIGLIALIALSIFKQGKASIDAANVVLVGGLHGLLVFVSLPKRWVGKWRKRLAALTVGGLISAALLEGYLRLFEPFPILLRAGRIDLPRGVSKHFTSNNTPGLDPTISVNYNSLGFRGPEPPPDWSRHLTILCVGGSTTQCLYLSNGTTWPDRLSQQLNVELDNVWVNNAGIDGHSTFGHLELFDQYLLKIRPRWLLFYVGLNDVDRVDLNSNELGALRIHSRSDDSIARAVQRSLLGSSDTFALLDNFRMQFAAKRKGLTHGQTIEHSHWTASFRQRTMSEEERLHWLSKRNPECLAGYRRRLQSLIERCRDNGIQCALATQPALYGEGVDPLTRVDLESIQVGEVDGWTQWQLLEKYNRATLEVGQELEVTVIDVASQLPKSSKYFYDLTHYNLEGAVEVAKIIHDELAPVLKN